MWRRTEVGRPRVFLSFGGNDRVTAERLRVDLQKREIEAFSFPPGGNLVLDINRALTQSDYFVLLWSQAACDRPWVEAEWSAAFIRELKERRSFLFVVRLDTTPLPTLLAPRQHLDALSRDWDEVVNELAVIWQRDLAVGAPVLPAPCLATADDAEAHRTVVLYVRNRALSVAHIVAVPAESTGRELESSVRNALALPDIQKMFGGAVGMRFYYRLNSNGEPVVLDKTLLESNIVDGATLDLEVAIETFSPNGSSPIIIYRQDALTDLSPATTRALINSAFRHLIPW